MPLATKSLALTTQECTKRLQNAAMGRLAFNDTQGPALLPVNFLYQEPNLMIRTDKGSKLTNSPLTLVTLEVDELDSEGQLLWCITARGPAFDLSNSADSYSLFLKSLTVDVWAPVPHSGYMKITVAELLGVAYSYSTVKEP